MRLLTFSPGPSKISDATYADMEAAMKNGLLEQSHRSPVFYEQSAACREGLKRYLNIPADYHVYFLCSATSAWHSIVANTVAKKSAHLINGAFSKKAATAAKLLYKDTATAEAPLGEQPDVASLSLPSDSELVTACYNESSSGVIMTPAQIQALREQFPDSLLSIDATSVAAALPLPIESADIWYFSVQKGFGLPAGLGVIAFSPRAYERSVALEQTHENLAGLWRWSEYDKACASQPGFTIQTPNMLGIYLLNAQVHRFIAAGGMEKIAERTLEKAKRIWNIIDAHGDLEHFVKDPTYRSPTVIAVSATPERITELHKKAKDADIILGKGYGDLKETTFRIANFPAITNEDIDRLEGVLNGP